MAIRPDAARRALKTSGMKYTLFEGWWPFGREERLRLLLHKRSAVLQAKNDVLDFLLQTQHSLARLGLNTLEQVKDSLMNPVTLRQIMAVGVTTSLLEEELSSRFSSEVSWGLDQALKELITEGLILRIPGRLLPTGQDILLAVHSQTRPRYNISDINRLLREDKDYGASLRTRYRKESTSEASRSYEIK